MTEYRALFKCRLCGTVYGSICTESKKTAEKAVVGVCMGIQAVPMGPHSADLHFCENGSVGLADFQGFAVKAVSENE